MTIRLPVIKASNNETVRPLFQRVAIWHTARWPGAATWSATLRVRSLMLFWILVPVLVVLGLLTLIAFTGSAGVETIADFEGHNATLTCYHCGNETQVGRKVCEHCHEELQ